LRGSLPIDMLLSALSFLVVAQSSSEVPEGLMNNPVLIAMAFITSSGLFLHTQLKLGNVTERDYLEYLGESNTVKPA